VASRPPERLGASLVSYEGGNTWKQDLAAGRAAAVERFLAVADAIKREAGVTEHVIIKSLSGRGGWGLGRLQIEGRDLSSRLIENKTQEAFVNQTSSQVATTLAQRRGLTPQVTATTTLVGRYYQQDHVRDSLNQFSRTTTEWDLLIYLAQREGFDVFVKGTTLYFQPTTDPSADPYVVRWDGVSSIALAMPPCISPTQLRPVRSSH
jgi:hypothetical protein